MPHSSVWETSKKCPWALMHFRLLLKQGLFRILSAWGHSNQCKSWDETRAQSCRFFSQQDLKTVLENFGTSSTKSLVKKGKKGLFACPFSSSGYDLSATEQIFWQLKIPFRLSNQGFSCGTLYRHFLTALKALMDQCLQKALNMLIILDHAWLMAFP